jgi:hypothetical protein
MEFELRFTDKEITAWGGMGLMKQMLDRIGLIEQWNGDRFGLALRGTLAFIPGACQL